MYRSLIFLFSTVFIVPGVLAQTTYKLDEAFCQRYDAAQPPLPLYPNYNYRACLKLEEWARTHPIEHENCLAKSTRYSDPKFGYARCLQDARTSERVAERQKCEKEAGERETPPSPAWFALMLQCEQLSRD